jgi:hypothetical protein
VSGEQQLEAVQRDLEAKRAAAPVAAHETVDAAVQASARALGQVSPGRAVLVRSVWSGAQKATVMVQGAQASQVAQAKAAGTQAGVQRMGQV